MERKGSCLSAVKRVISPKSKEKKEKKTRKLKGWFRKKKSKGLDSAQEAIAAMRPAPHSTVPVLGLVDAENVKFVDSVMEAENEQARPDYQVMNTEIEEEDPANLPKDAESDQARHATSVAAEASVAAAQAAAEVVRLTDVRSAAKSREEIAALKIQSVFKGYMARRALRSIQGLVRLKTLIQGPSVKHQAITTLRCMQTMARVQAEVRARRIRTSQENYAFQRRLQQKLHKELQKARPSIGENWNGSAQSKEQIEAKKQKKLEAAIKRERTLAYAYSHQQTWRDSSEPTTYTFMDPENPEWGWNWLERWMAVRLWENRAIEKEKTNDTMHAKSVTTLAQARRDLDLVKKPSSQIIAEKQILAPGRLSVSSPRIKTPNAASSGNARAQSSRQSVSSADGDARSNQSVQSERGRRHSVTRSSARHDEGLASSSALPSYMVPTESAKAKSRLSFEKTALPEKYSVVTPRKRLSFSTSPSTPRRHSVLD
ncbi:hypothetical protein Leryth_027345 [Lithospermum erythrorhizon]|nr:hypothetical protein Leryth_027345 [Lithospermum erythrorhizon]